MQNRTHAYPSHLFDISDMDDEAIERLLDRARSYYYLNRQPMKKQPELSGRTLINLFFEPSTRTRSSFELAGKRLGMDVINISSQVSATQKGESLIDTAMTLGAMQPDIIAVRHPQSGAAALMAQHVNCSLINAGDGCHAHPTQALLDAFTIRQHRQHIEGLRIAICGDIAHSRVARSGLQLLQRLGANLCLIAPPQLMPADAASLGCDLAYHMDDGIQDADIVMLLRVQHERIRQASIASVREYFHLYGLTYERLARARPDALVMHPGPINRGVEIDTALADDTNRNVILHQVESGVAVRMALLVDMLNTTNQET